MVQQSILLFIFFLFLGKVHGQDERYYRHILSGELPNFSETNGEAVFHQFNVKGPSYKLDLDGDKIEESLQPQKRDGVDWIEIRDHSERIIFAQKLLAMGSESVLYKIKLVQISPKVKALILFLDEGKTQGRGFESTARIYLVSYENNDLSTMKMIKGPHFFHEKEAQRDQYFRRKYMVNVYDVDNDGVREIVVQFNHIQRILKYAQKGEWTRI